MIRTGDIVRLNAEKYPNKVAVIREDIETRTWKELDDRSNQLARALQSLGVEKGDRVSLLARNRTECVEAFFACAKIGVIYTPINYRFAPAEIEYVLEDSGSQVLICDKEYADVIKGLSDKGRLGPIKNVIGFGGDHGLELDYSAVLSEHSADMPDAPDIDFDDVCWICYTGGTTGMSKGVMLTHRNNFVQCVQLGIADRIEHEDVYLVTGALFHVVLNMGLAYWFVGCSVVIMDFTPSKCLDMIQLHKVTKTVPIATMLNMLMQEQRKNPRDLSSLVLCGTGGGPISPDVVRRASQEWDCDFVQYFGQTEAAHHFTYLSASEYRRGLRDGATQRDRKRLESGGRAQHCDRVCVMDANDHVVPNGEVGEICAQGPNVMLGYWNKPDLTAQTLRNGWLHTGDVGYMDDDGYVYVVDRKKDMIVTGGENVYSTEVEAVLYRSDHVVECAVIGIPDEQWGEAVHAFIVKSSSAPSDEELKQELLVLAREYLAGYKIPKDITVVDELPKSATGKIQKMVLRDRFWEGKDKRVGASSAGISE